MTSSAKVMSLVVLSLLGFVIQYVAREGHGVRWNWRQQGTFALNRRSLLSRDPRSIEAKSSPTGPTDNLRFLYFGTSRTYGSGLRPVSENKHLTFPHLVSRHYTDRSVPAGSSQYPSACLHSIMKDVENNDSYDVIVLEFLRDVSDTMHLARRLRQRYPKAHMILLDVFIFSQFLIKGDNWRSIPLPEWIRNNAASVHLSRFIGWSKWTQEMPPSWTSEIKDLVQQKTKHDEWEYRNTAPLDDWQSDLKELDIHVISIPAVNAHYAVEKFSSWFLSDMLHFSRRGHWQIARVIGIHLRQSKFRSHHDATLGPWSEFDLCDNWFNTGNTTIAHDANLQMNEFVSGKHALEAIGPVTRFKVENRGSEPQDLSLQYMEASPECMYPNVEISILNGNDRAKVMVSCPTKSEYSYQVNIVKSVLIGTVPRGESTIEIRRLEEGKPWPFRIVGVIMSSKSNIAHAIDRAQEAWKQ